MILSVASRRAIVIDDPGIAEVSGWHLSAGGESPTLTVTLDRGGCLPSALVQLAQDPPLRAGASLADGSHTLFSGIVQAVRLGADISITLES